MLKKLGIFFIFVMVSISSKAIKVISIGQVCTVAGAMREYGIRNIAYPFDWLVSPFDALYKAIEEDFYHILHEPLTVRSFDRYAIIDYYGFHFSHDFPTIKPSEVIDVMKEQHMTGGVLCADWRDFLPQVKAKYLRRIERFKQVLSGTEKVYLIRQFDINQHQAIRLRDLLLRKYPQLDFILIVVGNSHDMKYAWNIDHIQNFYLNDNDVNNVQAQWNGIFKALTLEPLITKKYDDNENNIDRLDIATCEYCQGS